jgi:hypothetical protein
MTVVIEAGSKKRTVPLIVADGGSAVRDQWLEGFAAVQRKVRNAKAEEEAQKLLRKQSSATSLQPSAS